MIRSLLLIASLSLLTTAAAQEPGDIPAKTFAQLPMMRDAELSPDGSTLAYIRPINGRAHLILHDLSGQRNPVSVPPAKDLDIDWLHWANAERLVFLVSASRRRDFVETRESRLMAINKDGSNGVHIVQPRGRGRLGSRLSRDAPEAQLQGDVLHWLHDEPNHILLALDSDQDGAYEVRKIDIRNGTYQELRDGTAGIQSWLTDQTGNLRFGWGYRRQSFRTIFQTGDGKWRSGDAAGWWEDGLMPLGFTEEPDVAFMSGLSAEGYRVIYTVNVKTGEMQDTVFSRPGVDAENLVYDPITQLPIGVAYADEYYRIEYFDAEMEALNKGIAKALPGHSYSIASMTADRRKVLIRASGPSDPGRYLYLDRDTSQLSHIADIMPGLPPELLSAPEPVSYAARDGLTIPAYVTFPLGHARENLPFIVLPHGGPTARDDGSFWFLSQFLAARGYGILQPNFRGSTGYGKEFELAGRKEWGGKMQEDVTDGVRWLIDQGFADPERICIVGWSYGGYSAAIGAVQTPELYQCAASINGVLNLPRMIGDDRQYIGGTVWTKHIGLAGEKTKAVSPYHQADKLAIPLLIIQAEDDVRVHADQGRTMAKRLKRLKKPHQYVEVELGGHSMTNEAARLTILTSLESFLEQNLSP